MSHTSLVVPTVHLNGSGHRLLMRQHREMLNALQGALDALRTNAPHGRDYYVQDAGAYDRARVEQEDRLERIQGVYDEIHAIALAIDAQETTR